MKHFKVYLAGPISGHSYESVVKWRDYFIENIPKEIIAYSPLRGKSYLNNESILGTHYNDKILSTTKGIMSRDYYDCTSADLVVANLLNTKTVTIGTVLEIAWAYAFRIPLVLIIEKEGNVHQHPMLLEAAGFIVDNVADAVEITKAVLLPVLHTDCYSQDAYQHA